MLKFYKVSMFLYLFMAGFAFFMAYSTWNEAGNKKYIMLFFAFMAVGMFFFRRKFIKKLEAQNEL